MVDVNKIPETEARNIGMTFLDAVKAFYSDPENVKRFEAWKASRENSATN